VLRFAFGVSAGPAVATHFRAALAADVGAFGLAFRNMAFDNQALPRRPEGAPRWHMVVGVRAGTILVNEVPLGAGRALLISDRVLLPSEPVDTRLRAGPGPVDLVVVRVPSARVRRPSAAPLLLDDPDLGEDLALVEGGLQEDGEVPAPALCEGIHRTWARLVDGGLLDGGQGPELELGMPADRAVRRVAHAFSHALSCLERDPHLIDLVDLTQVTERQLLRDMVEVQARFGIVVRGWRDTIHFWRLVAATMFLGHAPLRMHEVARAVGFASTTTMARAFRQAGLPRPTEVRAVHERKSAAVPMRA